MMQLQKSTVTEQKATAQWGLFHKNQQHLWQMKYSAYGTK
jgi:hypothetical protein